MFDPLGLFVKIKRKPQEEKEDVTVLKFTSEQSCLIVRVA